MTLELKDVERIAHLARLELQPAEAPRMQGHINDFFAIVEKISAVDTQGIQPLAHPLDMIEPVALRLREDVASEPNAREANQANAPALESGLFLVPKVIE